MEVLILQVFVSLALVFGSLLLFAISTRQRDHEHADRLALLPLQDDTGASRPAEMPHPPSLDMQRDPSTTRLPDQGT